MKKTIALVAHDNRKQDLVEWVGFNWDSLIRHKLVCTGTTGKLVEQALRNKLVESEKKEKFKIDLIKLSSGPLGGDQQLGAMISEDKIDIMIFLWDPMEPQPHDVDIKALLRITVLYNIPTACNRSTADFIVSSTIFNRKYERTLKDYSTYLNRDLYDKI